MLLVKKVELDCPSILAFTTIFTPLGGMVEVISIFNGKVGPRIFKLLEAFAGVVTTTRLDSVGPLLFLQAGLTKSTIAMSNNPSVLIFMISDY